MGDHLVLERYYWFDAQVRAKGFRVPHMRGDKILLGDILHNALFP